MSPIISAGVIPADSAETSPESAATANISLPSSKLRITAEDGLSPPVKTTPSKCPPKLFLEFYHKPH
jgi:hypothetical protein